MAAAVREASLASPTRNHRGVPLRRPPFTIGGAERHPAGGWNSGRLQRRRPAGPPRYFSPSRRVLKNAADISRVKLALVVASAFIHSI